VRHGSYGINEFARQWFKSCARGAFATPRAEICCAVSALGRQAAHQRSLWGGNPVPTAIMTALRQLQLLTDRALCFCAAPLAYVGHVDQAVGEKNG
jgi:hypothetical protein